MNFHAHREGPIKRSRVVSPKLYAFSVNILSAAQKKGEKNYFSNVCSSAFFFNFFSASLLKKLCLAVPRPYLLKFLKMIEWMFISSKTLAHSWIM